jgi:hypothetical protein
VAENCAAVPAAPALVSVIFHALVADLTAESLALAALHPAGIAERGLLAEIVAVPETCAADLEAVSQWIAERYPCA